MRRALLLAALTFVPGVPVRRQAGDPNDLSGQVEIIRTAYGVPHIRAASLRAAGYGLAWVQLEDYGPMVALGLLRERGQMARLFGRDSIESDFLARPAAAWARGEYQRLDQATRDVYEGFAAGVNRYVTLHLDQFPEGFPADFSGYDVVLRDAGGSGLGAARRFLARLSQPARGGAPPAPGLEGAPPPPNPDEGSNAWALGPGRSATKSAMLLRNPHLAWDAGYYEAQLTVPGVLDFYGDFRIGGPFTVIGGFNAALGWATTNNAPVLNAIYALDVAPGQTDQVLLDGTAVPLTRETVTVEYRNGAGSSSETREGWRSPIGPVIARTGGKVYVLRAAGNEELRGGEQFLRMMRAGSFSEWREAMRMNARSTSSFTYADRDGNIFYVWDATQPVFPHPLRGDTAAVPAARTGDVWTRYVPWDSLPQLKNPKSGYLHNENDPPHFTNLEQPLDSASLPPTVPPPALSLRSQMALQLLRTSKKKLTLEEVVKLKFDPHMLLADRVKPALLAATAAAGPDSSLTEAAQILAAWDNSTGIESRGGVLFEAWWRRYAAGPRATPRFEVAWTREDPVRTPRGLADPVQAVAALRAVLPEVRRKYGRLDAAWGEVHRVRAGGKDLPTTGCPGDLGCFRVLLFEEDKDGKQVARGGDGWILAVEFAKTGPRALSVLAYGESPREGSPYNGDQAELFVRGEMKRVAFTAADIDAGAVKRYHPGAQP